MTSSTRRRAVMLASAALVVLVACNPLTLRRNDSGNYVATYTGPSGGWLEASVTEPQGVEVDYRLLVLGEDVNPRSCRDAATGAVEDCEPYGGASFTDLYSVGGTGFRSAVSPLDADLVVLLAWCTDGGASVTCPTLRVTLRVVNAAGALIGDLRDETPA